MGKLRLIFNSVTQLHLYSAVLQSNAATEQRNSLQSSMAQYSYLWFMVRVNLFTLCSYCIDQTMCLRY